MDVSQGVSGQVQASISFGRIVHRAAVQVGSKTELGRRIGQDKEVIRKITLGMAHTHDRVLLESLVVAIEKDVHPDTLIHMRQLIDEMKQN